MSARTRIKCSGCGRRISQSEPDLVLRRHGSERKRYYHRRCFAAAQKVVVGCLDLWFLTNRYIDAEAN